MQREEHSSRTSTKIRLEEEKENITLKHSVQYFTIYQFPQEHNKDGIRTLLSHKIKILENKD